MSQGQNTYRERSSAAVGWISFAAIMLIMIGVFHAIAGLAGIIENEFYSVVPAAGTEATGDVYFLQFDATTWGWIHLIGGIIVLLAGFSLFRGRGLGSDRRRDRGGDQCHRELCVATVVSGLVDHDDRDRHHRDLGIDRTRTRHHRGRVGGRQPGPGTLVSILLVVTLSPGSPVICMYP